MWRSILLVSFHIFTGVISQRQQCPTACIAELGSKFESRLNSIESILTENRSGNNRYSSGIDAKCSSNLERELQQLKNARIQDFETRLTEAERKAAEAYERVQTLEYQLNQMKEYNTTHHQQQTPEENQSLGVDLILKAYSCSKARSLNLETLGGKQYFFQKSGGVHTWYKSKEFCEKHGMHLASPKNKEELQHLYNYADTNYISGITFWVSASDIGQLPGQFKWHDGTALDKNSDMWARFEPNSFGAGKNTSVYLQVEGSFLLNDAGADRQDFFICQLDNRKCPKN